MNRPGSGFFSIIWLLSYCDPAPSAIVVTPGVTGGAPAGLGTMVDL